MSDSGDGNDNRISTIPCPEEIPFNTSKAKKESSIIDHDESLAGSIERRCVPEKVEKEADKQLSTSMIMMSEPSELLAESKGHNSSGASIDVITDGQSVEDSSPIASESSKESLSSLVDKSKTKELQEKVEKFPGSIINSDDASEGKTPENNNSDAVELIEVSFGPYSVSKLIKNIVFYNPDIPESKNSYATSIESWESNIYVGTSIGEILHFFKIEADGEYILISRQRINDKKIRPINKIILLPSISRALVLNGSIVSTFMLPEFSSANLGKIKDVQDLSIDHNNYVYDVEHKNKVVPGNINGVPVIAYTKTKIRVISVSESTLKLVKDINYPFAWKGVRRGALSVVANKSGYELIDLNNIQKIPLFPISNDTAGSESLLEPLICPCGKNEYMLSSGTKKNEPSMGMIINNNGDISRGTISWPSYPTSISVDYPYSIGIFEKHAIINSILDQKQIQHLELPRDDLKVFNVSHSYDKPYQGLTDVIKLVPLNGSKDNTARLALEEEKANELSIVSSSSVLYGGRDVWILTAIPRLMRLQSLELKSNVIDELEDQLTTIDKSSKLGHIELQFMKLLLGLVYLSTANLDQGFDLWSEGDLDPRVLLHVFGITYYGDMWIFNGLCDKIEHLRNTLKPEDLREFYKLVLNKWLSKKKDERLQDDDLFKSLEIALVKEYLNTRDILYVIENNQIQLMIPETLKLLEDSKNYYALLKLCEKTKDVNKFCDVCFKLINTDYVDDLFKKEVDNLPQFFADYLIDNCENEKMLWDYGLKLVQLHPTIGLRVFLSDKLKVKFSEAQLIKALPKKSKVSYMEILIQTKDMSEFTGDIAIEYIELLIEDLENQEQLTVSFDLLLRKYKELSNPKMNLLRFLEIEQKKCLFPSFIDLFFKAYASLSKIEPTAKRIVYMEQKTVLEKTKELLGTQKCLRYLKIVPEFKLSNYEIVIEILCSFSDYLSCEMLATKGQLPPDNHSTYKSHSPKIFMDEAQSRLLISKIFDEYLQIADEELTETFLYKYNSKMDLLETINKIPSHYSIQFMYNILVKGLVSLNSKHSQTVLHKNISRSQAKYYGNVLHDFKNLQLQDFEDNDDDNNENLGI